MAPVLRCGLMLSLFQRCLQWLAVFCCSGFPFLFLVPPLSLFAMSERSKHMSALRHPFVRLTVSSSVMLALRGDRPLLGGVQCHSTSWAAMTGVPLEAICEAASWTAPSTFARFYKVNVATLYPLQGILEQLPSASR
ncbi:hypothetical protein XENOCAPTIV_024810 [Xenoophorus captivus]|uniref:Secreted protein n=1 Tax=Xenoophorus captivus TaxID=1517983 RepID=A0ABV0R4P7_9TELE